MIVRIRDEIDRVRGLFRCYSLLVKDGEHKNYKSDPLEDLGIVIDEMLDKIENTLRESDVD